VIPAGLASGTDVERRWMLDLRRSFCQTLGRVALAGELDGVARDEEAEVAGEEESSGIAGAGGRAADGVGALLRVTGSVAGRGRVSSGSVSSASGVAGGLAVIRGGSSTSASSSSASSTSATLSVLTARECVRLPRGDAQLWMLERQRPSAVAVGLPGRKSQLPTLWRVGCALGSRRRSCRAASGGSARSTVFARYAGPRAPRKNGDASSALVLGRCAGFFARHCATSATKAADSGVVPSPQVRGRIGGASVTLRPS
jgi:hypothetical protein